MRAVQRAHVVTQSPFLTFSRSEWARLRGATPMTLSQGDIDEIKGINEELSLGEVEEVYLPLSRLLNLHIAAVQDLHRVTSRFVGSVSPKVPYVIAIAGSVSAGKSTTARLLRTLLSRWENHPRVDLVTTDGFLFPNATLEERGLMDRKGFPESYDRPRLVRFVADVKSGKSPLRIPVYSHLHYDIVPDEFQSVESPDIVILEGLNVLQSGTATPLFVSDFVDFSLYVDAAPEHLESWFMTRFRRLRETAFRDPESFFHRFADVPEEEAMAMARDVWARINLANLHENILPTRERARLILVKGEDHVVERILMRRV
jgi:type I pantothenate kinase